MKILAIESSSLVASVALAEDDTLIAEYTSNYKKTHSQTLLPMIDEMCRMVEFDPKEVDAIAVSAGPGSFTGLRIGSATAKGLGLAWKKPLIAVPTVEAMAYNFYDSSRLVVPIMDARRKQVYTGIYRCKDGTVETVLGQCLITIDILMDKIEELGENVVFLGDGVPVFREELEEKLTVSAVFAPLQMNRQRASSVAKLGEKYFAEGKIQTAAEHAPDYIRPSQAEREGAIPKGRKQNQ